MPILRRPLVLFGVVLCLAATSSGPSSASEAEGFTISDKQLNQSKEFPPIVVFNPSAQAADPTLDDCKSLPSDVAVKITFAIKSDVPTKSQFAVSWQGGGDIDVYFFDNGGELISDAASSDNPEKFNMGGLPNGDYWVCVRKFSGANTGFTVSVKANFLSLFERAAETPSPTPQPTATPPPAARPGLSEPTTPPTTPEVVETPGSDSGSSQRELVAVSGNRQADAADKGRSGLSIGLLALTGVIVATGAGLVFVRIRRDTKLR